MPQYMGTCIMPRPIDGDRIFRANWLKNMFAVPEDTKVLFHTAEGSVVLDERSKLTFELERASDETFIIIVPASPSHCSWQSPVHLLHPTTNSDNLLPRQFHGSNIRSRFTKSLDNGWSGSWFAFSQDAECPERGWWRGDGHHGAGADRREGR